MDVRLEIYRADLKQIKSDHRADVDATEPEDDGNNYYNKRYF